MSDTPFVPPHEAPADTVTPPPDDTVTPTMYIVIGQLIAGDTITAAAAAGVVSRRTVHRWLRDHVGFRAAYYRARRDLHDRLKLRLEAATEQALENIVNAVRGGDLSTSKYVLNRLALPPIARPAAQLEDPEFLRLLAQLREAGLSEMEALVEREVNQVEVEDRIRVLESKDPDAREALRRVSLKMGQSKFFQEYGEFLRAERERKRVERMQEWARRDEERGPVTDAIEAHVARRRAAAEDVDDPDAPR